MGPQNYACILLLPLVSGLVGYDCGGHGLNITTLSLQDVGDCELAGVHTVTEETYVQLLQLTNYDRTKIQQCKVEMHHPLLRHALAYLRCAQRSQNILTHPVEFWLVSQILYRQYICVSAFGGRERSHDIHQYLIERDARCVCKHHGLSSFYAD